MILRALIAFLLTLPLFAEQFELLPQVQCTGRGIFLEQLFSSNSPVVPSVRLGDAPALGRIVVIPRDRVFEELRKAGADLAAVSLAGAERVRVSRKSRTLAEADLRELLAAELGRQYLRDRGELEIRFARGWATINIPDDPLRLQILDLPTGGISPNFIVRAEIHAGSETLGAWHIPIQARIWKDVLIARNPVFRGQAFRDADLVRERRDVLALRDALASVPNEDSLEFAESIPAGQPVLARAVRMRPVVRRGKTVEALVRDGAVSITLKVEVLEDGIPGQTVRVRNLQSRKEFRGKVQDEQTIVVLL